MNVTEKIYKGVEIPTFLDVKWGERTTQPVFTNQGSDGRLDEGGVNISSSSTTVIYNGNIYILQYVQLNTPTHPSFQLNPSTMEMTLTFTVTDNESTNDKVIIIVLPFHEDDTIKGDPMYLEKILDINNQKSTSLSSCLPAASENTFAYYSSCIVDPQNPNNSLGNVIVFISIFGTRVTSTTINNIKTLYNPEPTKFPGFTPPTVLQGLNAASVLDNTNFIARISASPNSIPDGSTVSSPSKMDVRTDNVDAYKCVPFDPDNDVKNGTIQVDLDTGKPLTDTLGDRTKSKERPVTENVNSISPGKIERFLGNSLGIFLAICFGIAIFYLSVKIFRGYFWPDAISENALPGWIKASPIIILVAFLFAFIGFLTGSTLSSGS